MGYCSWCPYLNKWWTFTASIFAALSCGLTYCFPLWSGVLKETYQLTQAQLELVGSAANVGGYSAIVSGLVYDALQGHKKFGPRIVLVVGLALNAAGYLGLWGAITGRFTVTFWQLVGLTALASNGGTWLDTATLVTNVRNFPSSRGSVTGVLKASVGLSGSLYACIYSGLFAPDTGKLLLMLALGPAAVGILALPLINHCSFVQSSELEAGQHVFTTEGRFIWALQSLGTLAVFLITSSTVAALHPLAPSARLMTTAGACLLLLPLLLVPHGSGGFLSKKAPGRLELDLAMYDEEEECEGNGDAADDHLRQPMLSPPDVEQSPGAAAAPTAQQQQRQQQQQQLQAPRRIFPDIGPAQSLRTANFWLLFTVCTIGMGSGLTFLNNLAQLVKALSGPADAIPVLVSLYSVGNCGGRMALGYIPEQLLHIRGTSRLLWLPLVSLAMSGACMALAYASLDGLYPLAVLSGFAFGGHWALFPSYASELFGLYHFASTYTLLQFAPATGSFGLAMGLAGWLYERALSRQGSTEITCIGPDCFKETFLVLAGLGCIATACAVQLYRRNRGLYRLHRDELTTYDRATLRAIST